MGPATKGLFGAPQFAAMRTDAIFVNTSRAGLIDEAALVAALAKGRPGVAALDVFSEEPLPVSHPLLDAPNVLLTPHLGFAPNRCSAASMPMRWRRSRRGSMAPLPRILATFEPKPVVERDRSAAARDQIEQRCRPRQVRRPRVR